MGSCIDDNQRIQALKFVTNKNNLVQFLEDHEIETGGEAEHKIIGFEDEANGHFLYQIYAHDVKV